MCALQLHQKCSHIGPCMHYSCTKNSPTLGGITPINLIVRAVTVLVNPYACSKEGWSCYAFFRKYADSLWSTVEIQCSQQPKLRNSAWSTVKTPKRAGPSFGYLYARLLPFQCKDPTYTLIKVGAALNLGK